jgi:hypothetical protein
MMMDRQAEREILERFAKLAAEDRIQALQEMVAILKKAHPQVEAEMLGMSRASIPLGIFSQDKLSCLEAIVKYLKEITGMKLGLIAKLLSRDNRTIWCTYANATRKMPEPFSIAEGMHMPAHRIADRRLSVLEHVVWYAKSLGKTNHEVALLLHLDDRTIWSVYDKVKRKEKHEHAP